MYICHLLGDLCGIRYSKRCIFSTHFILVVNGTVTLVFLKRFLDQSCFSFFKLKGSCQQTLEMLIKDSEARAIFCFPLSFSLLFNRISRMPNCFLM